MDEKTLSELLVDAEIALRNYLVAKSQACHPRGCCSERRHLCAYHEGYSDALDLALDYSTIIEEFSKGTDHDQ
jgi:hypothetical protein